MRGVRAREKHNYFAQDGVLANDSMLTDEPLQLIASHSWYCIWYTQVSRLSRGSDASGQFAGFPCTHAVVSDAAIAYSFMPIAHR